MPDDSTAETPPVAPTPRVAPAEHRPKPWLKFVAAGIAGAVAGAGAVALPWALSTSSPKPNPPAFTLAGDLTLNGNTSKTGDGTCAGRGGYNDIAEGTTVTVYDGKGQIIATGRLGRGAFSLSSFTACQFPISVADVPSDAAFYQVEVSHRGKLPLTAQDAKAGQLHATLG